MTPMPDPMRSYGLEIPDDLDRWLTWAGVELDTDLGGVLGESARLLIRVLKAQRDGDRLVLVGEDGEEVEIELPGAAEHQP